MAKSKQALRIDVYSHFIKVSGYDQDVKDALVRWTIRRLGQKGLVRQPNGRYTQELLRIFAASNRGRTIMRFNRSLMQEVITELQNCGVYRDSIEIVEHDLYEPEPIDLELIDSRELRDYQKTHKEHMLTHGVTKFCGLPPGAGKALRATEHVRVPKGWVPIGELKVGDTVVAADGKTCQVTSVYPQGVRKGYVVGFEDGRRIEADADHLWRVQFRNGVTEVLTTSRIENRIREAPSIETVGAIDRVETELPLDPYVFGVWLLRGKGASFRISDPTVIRKCDWLRPRGTRVMTRQSGDTVVGFAFKRDKKLDFPESNPHPFKAILKDTGLYGVRYDNRWIPEGYLEGSYSQRLQLLEGILDASVTRSKRHPEIEVGIYPYGVAKGIRRLVWSLGGICHYGVRNERKGTVYVSLRMRLPFALDRETLKEFDFGVRSPIRNRIVEVYPHGQYETVCISIDHPERQFITTNYIVTHNTITTNHALLEWSRRVAIVIRPMYIQRWLDDLNDVFALEAGDIEVVSGGPQLERLFKGVLSGKLNPKIIIISNKTLQGYLKLWDLEGENFGYSIYPDELYEKLKVGVRVIDEVHQDFHLNFRQDLYTHIPKTISLSGTLDSDDAFTNRMYEIMFPKETRGPHYEQEKYIVVNNVWYRFDERSFKVLSYINRMKSYSHIALENTLHRQKWLRERYVNMLVDMVDTHYIENREPGQKCAVYCSTVEMCKVVRDKLKGRWPHLNIEKYTQEEPYEVLLNADIAVTTLQSAGTAVDIPNLKVIISSIALSSKQANEQLVKRLRKLKDWPNETPQFFFMCAENIDKHRQYAEEKFVKLDGKVKTIRNMETGFRL